MIQQFIREEQITPASERTFATVMAAALALFGIINWWHEGSVWPWLVGIAAVLLITGCFYPTALRPLNLAWFKFGVVLHAVANPIVMGLIFYGAVLPTNLVMRAMGKDPLGLKFEPDRISYWISRQPPGPPPETMKDQF